MSNSPTHPSIDVVMTATENALSAIDDAASSHDDKALFVAASSTAIVALVAPSLGSFPKWVCGVYLLAYLAVLAASFIVYQPKNFQLSAGDPVKARDYLLNKSEEESKKLIMEALVSVYQNNYKIRLHKLKWVTYSLHLLNALILFSVILLFYPLFAKKAEDKAPVVPPVALPVAPPARRPNVKKPSVAARQATKTTAINSLHSSH